MPGCMQANGQEQVQHVAQKALALLAATQLLAAPIAGLQSYWQEHVWTNFCSTISLCVY